MSQEDRLTGLVGYSGMKVPVRVATTAAITLSGEQTIDGVAVVTDDRVLVKDQASSIDNGIYIADTGSWSRAPDADGSYDFRNGTLIPVAAGSTYGGYVFKTSGTDPIDPGTDAMTFSVGLFSTLAGATFLQAGTGATSRAAQDKMREVFSVKDFGATGDGVTDDSTYIQAAIDAANTAGNAVYFPEGTYITDKVTIYTDTHIFGDGPNKTTIKLKDTTNDYLIYGSGSDALWGTNTDAGISNYQIRELTLDGNLANNATGLDCIAVYGQKPIIENVYIKNAKRRGMYTEWYQYGEAVFGMEGDYKNIRIDGCGQEGWYNNGPHDSHIMNVTIIDCSQTTDNTYSGYRVGTYGASHHVNVHVWSRSTATKFHKYGIEVASIGNSWVNCIAEGAKTANTFVSAVRNSFTNHFSYSSRGTYNVLFRAGDQIYRGGFLGTPISTATPPVGITLGLSSTDSVASCIIEVVAVEQTGGVVDWTYSQGRNRVVMRGTQASGGVNYIGNPAAQDSADLSITGSGAFTLFSDPYYVGITATGTTQSDATVLSQGYKTYQIGAGSSVGAGFRLWPPKPGENGIMIYNASTVALTMWPSTGVQINSAGANLSVPLSTSKGLILHAISTGQWYGGALSTF